MPPFLSRAECTIPSWWTGRRHPCVPSAGMGDGRMRAVPAWSGAHAAAPSPTTELSAKSVFGRPSRRGRHDVVQVPGRRPSAVPPPPCTARYLSYPIGHRHIRPARCVAALFADTPLRARGARPRRARTAPRPPSSQTYVRRRCTTYLLHCVPTVPCIRAPYGPTAPSIPPRRTRGREGEAVLAGLGRFSGAERRISALSIPPPCDSGSLGVCMHVASRGEGGMSDVGMRWQGWAGLGRRVRRCTAPGPISGPRLGAAHSVAERAEPVLPLTPSGASG